MKRSHVAAVVLVACGACGGNVILDGNAGGGGSVGAAGSIGVGGSVDVGPGAGGAVVMTGATGGGGPVTSCVSTECSAGMDGSCACTGICANGDNVSAQCPPGNGPCTCSLMGSNLSKVGSCTPFGEANPCDIAMGCCASFF